MREGRAHEDGRLGSRGLASSPRVGFGRGRSPARGVSAGETWTTRIPLRRSARRSSSASTGSTPRRCTASATRRRSCGARSSRTAGRGRLRLHEVRTPLGGPSGRSHRERPATRVDPRGVQASLRRPGSSASISTRRTGPTGRPARCWRTRGGTMAELVDEGKCAGSGVANFDEDLLACCEAIRHVDSVQPTLSLLARGSLQAIIPWAAEHGAGVICYSPMASGLLTGSFDRERLAALGDDDWRTRSPAFQEPDVSRSWPSSIAYVGSRTSCRRRRPRSQSRGCSHSPASPARSSAVVPPATSTAGRPQRSSRWTPGCSRRSPGRSRRPAPARTSRPRHRRMSLRPPRGAVRLGSVVDGEDQRCDPRRRGRTPTASTSSLSRAGRARAETYAGERAARGVTARHEALLADDEIDGVYISLPNRHITSGRSPRSTRRARPLREAVLAPSRRGRGGVRPRRLGGARVDGGVCVSPPTRPPPSRRWSRTALSAASGS